MAETMAAASATSGISRLSKLIVATAVLASLLEIIDTSIVNVAIPRMQGNLGVTLDEITWVSTGYIISNAIVLPISGWLGLKFGRKQYFTSCILLFTATSFLCGIAPNFGFLVFARVIQGAAGGALLPTAQAIIQEQFPGEKAGIGSAIYGVSVMVGPAIGPTLGGYLTDNFNWRWIFNINIPIGIVGAILSYLVIDEPEHGQKRDTGRVDLMGFTLLVLGLGSLQFMLERGQADNWFSSPYILVSAVVAAMGLPLFYAWESNNKDPIVDVKMFRESAIANGTLLMGGTGLVLYSIIFIIPVFTDRIVGMDTTHTGILYIPGSLATMVTMIIAGRYLAKIGPKPMIGFGIALISYSIYKLSILTTRAGAPDIVWPLITRGVALGFIFVPINAMVLSQFTGKKLGQASGLLNLSRQIGGSIGIAAISTFLDRFSSQIKNDLLPYISSVGAQAQSELSKGVAANATALQSQVGINQSTVGIGDQSFAALKNLSERLDRQVFQLSFNRIMIGILFVYALSFIPLFRIKLTKKISGPVPLE